MNIRREPVYGYPIETVLMGSLYNLCFKAEKNVYHYNLQVGTKPKVWGSK